MNSNLNIIESEIYDKCELKISDFIIETESREYDACQFELNGMEQDDKQTSGKNSKSKIVLKRFESVILKTFRF